MNQTLQVSAIPQGTVIDHITTGQGLRLIHLLSLKNSNNTITIGLNLPSKRLGKKDIIKIEDRLLTQQEANEIIVFAPASTINIIKDFKVTDKIKTHLPDRIKAIFNCPNPTCITHTETIDSFFYIDQQSHHTQLTCHYCDKIFDRDQVKVKI